MFNSQRQGFVVAHDEDGEPEVTMDFTDKEIEVKKLLQEHYVLNAITAKLRTDDQKKRLKEIKKLLSAIGKELVDDVSKKMKKN